MSENIQIFIAIFTGIGLLLLFILKFKWHAFLSLLIAAICIGVISGIPLQSIPSLVTKGMGDTLGFVATIIGLGCLFGYLLEQSGGAYAIAHYLLKLSGPKFSRPAILLTGYLLAIPVFFDVAFLMMFPLVKSLASRSARPLTYFSLPLLVGIALTHSFVPPTPGPVAVADILNVDLGMMIGVGLLITWPTALLGLWCSKWLIIPSEIRTENQVEIDPLKINDHLTISVFRPILIILLPLVLMVISTILSTVHGEGKFWIDLFIFLGHPIIALLLATLLALILFQKSTSLNIQKLLESALLPAGSIILITGAGGVLKQILIQTGLGELIAEFFKENPSTILFMAYGSAAIMRILQGSATIAMITAAGIVSASVQEILYTEPLFAVLSALSIASGSIIASHVNDSGFWLINRLSQQTVNETIKTFTVLSTLLSIISFGMILLVSMFL